MSTYYVLWGGGYLECGTNGLEYKHSATDILKMFTSEQNISGKNTDNANIPSSYFPSKPKNISDADVFLYEVPDGKVHHIKSCCTSKMKCVYSSGSKLFNDNTNIWYASFYVGGDSANTFTVGCDYNDFSDAHNNKRMPSDIRKYFYYSSGEITAYYSFRQNAFSGSSATSSPHSATNRTTQGMFNGCTLLTKCEVPGEMQTISKDTFKGCTSLTSYTENPDFIIKLDESAFENSGLRQILIPKYADISNNTFKGCTQATMIVWDGVTSSSDTKCNMTKIPQGAFSGCTSLKDTKFNSASTTSYTNNIVMANGITGISTSAFEGCRSIKKLTLNDVTSIGQNAFSGCTGLTTIDYKPSTSIYASGGSFANCTSLTSFTFDGSSNIGGKTYWNVAEGAFSGCSNLLEIKFGASVNNTSNLNLKGIGTSSATIEVLIQYNGSSNICETLINTFDTSRKINFRICGTHSYIQYSEFYSGIDKWNFIACN